MNTINLHHTNMDREKTSNAIVDESSIFTSARNSLDPLRWSSRKKHLILAAMCYMSFLTDFLAGIGVPMMVSQSEEWNVSLVDISRSLTGNTFTQGIGSLIAVPFARRFGYLPVMFWSTLLTVFFTMGCAVMPTWIGFIAVRILQGFFSTTAQVLGLTIIQEMFFFEEHVGKINIWGWSFLVGPYFGPFISSFILRSLTWRQSFWFFSGLVAVGFLSVIFIMDETAYDREMPENNPPRPRGYWNYKIQSLTGVMGKKTKGRTSLLQASIELYRVFSQPHFFCLFLFHGITYCWTVGINGTLITFLVPSVSKGGYGFDTVDVGLIYLAPIVAIIAGELFGHFVNEEIQTRTIRTQKGRFIPEHRLLALIPATFLMGVGVSLLGWALGKHWHWLSVAIFWGIFVFATMCSTVVISAYLLDSFPNDSIAVAALLNFTRVLFGFLVPIFQNPWAEKVGAEWSLSTQGTICVVAYGLVLVVQMWGREWRVRAEMCPDEITVEWSFDER
ncbi:major facilitator superfamily domain-containing protein [Trichophaea hybrida]|nr:major facilitator superfamily domain-containing protein [Trichophaea hybrida]